MANEHEYRGSIVWTGNRGQGTSHYRAYDRTWRMNLPGKVEVDCSNDPLLGGDPTKYNPEDLLLCALSSCHMLWYLHLASNARITILSYEDRPSGIGETDSNGAGRFLSATLRPRIELVVGSDLNLAESLHPKVH